MPRVTTSVADPLYTVCSVLFGIYLSKKVEFETMDESGVRFRMGKMKRLVLPFSLEFSLTFVKGGMVGMDLGSLFSFLFRPHYREISEKRK
ncbi:hypothetical protein BT96DRAFT_912414 [Gymnopus androsaceus JB14]|uniref:Uncharacterized protein n=1 Tax=Gymnopus androsaceus JB14 TaxID=1447944 RepID=A0A6A4IMN6_9AGAR|nr:hypothetical protein BT96DRAFT_912414 [Gymnopus androsaceus JB14]